MVCLLKEHAPPPPSRFQYRCLTKCSAGILKSHWKTKYSPTKSYRQLYDSGNLSLTENSVHPRQRAYISYPLTLWNENHCTTDLNLDCSFDVCIKKVLLLKIVRQVTLNYLSRSDTAKMCLQSGSWMNSASSSSSPPRNVSVMRSVLSFLSHKAQMQGSPHKPRQRWALFLIPHSGIFLQGSLHLGRSHGSPHSLVHL